MNALLPLAGCLATALFAGLAMDDAPVGYTDTPLLPGQAWKVHDRDRPVPPVVEPGAGANLGATPPADATVLFDGRDTDAWHAGGEAIGWQVEGGAMVVVGGSGSIESRASFGDLQLHLEWASPREVEGESQQRGNSGVFLMGRYEIQILDSFENRTYADGQAAALYGQYPPDANVCRAPGEWQSYDIVFRAPRFEGDTLVAPARVTVHHNGVLVHDAREFVGATRHREVATYAPHPPTGPIALQDHGNPVRFRNIWVRSL
ncbi:MAG: DUF1080 domain-containing protein [Planctomycetota bacterium]